MMWGFVPADQRRTFQDVDTVDTELSLEDLAVRRWRRECLLSMGLTLTDSRLLSESDADLHYMLALLRNGASGEQVRRIVL